MSEGLHARRSRTNLRLSLVLPLLVFADRAVPPANSAPHSPFTVADSLREEGKLIEAQSLYRQIRDSLALLPHSANLWRAQLWWSDTYRRRGVSDSARIGLVQAMRLAGSDPKPPAQALLAVRRNWIMAGGPEGHPSRWAPFILVGSGLQ